MVSYGTLNGEDYRRPFRNITSFEGIAYRSRLLELFER